MAPVKTKLVNLRVSLQELEGWRGCASAEGLSLSAWIRGRCAQEPGSVGRVPPAATAAAVAEKRARLEGALSGVGKASRPSIDAVLSDPRLVGRVFRGPDFKGGRR